MSLKIKERAVQPKASDPAPADEAMRRALQEGEARTRAYEMTLDERQRPAWRLPME